MSFGSVRPAAGCPYSVTLPHPQSPALPQHASRFSILQSLPRQTGVAQGSVTIGDAGMHSTGMDIDNQPTICRGHPSAR